MPPNSFPTASHAGDPPVHSAALVLVHWLTAALVVVAVLAGLLHGAVDDKAIRSVLLALHRQAGLSALVLLVLRVVARLAQGARAMLASSTPRWMALLAQATHIALYLLMVAVPVLGWMLSDARGQHPALWGLLPLPGLVAVDPDLADLLEDRHELVAWGMVVLIGLHAAAAAWHQWVRRDGLMQRMRWPRRPAAPDLG